MGLRKELIKYSYQVINGNTTACKKHKGACQRFLKDLERENTDEFPYIFDELKGERFLKWFRLFKHSKGAIAGDFLEAHIIQKFVFGNVYGWVHRDTKLRRFRKFYWQVGKKNAKTQNLAVAATYELGYFGELGSEVYCAGIKRDQSKLVFNEAITMLRNSFFKNEFNMSYGILWHQKSNSLMRPLSEDDQKKGDGLNPQLGIVDEYMAHPTTEIYDVLESGMLARLQPLIASITTAGLDLRNPCYTIEYDLVSKILNPDLDFDLPEYFAMVNELDRDDEGNLLDDIKDESCWLKPNPIAASYAVGRNFIRSRVNSALATPEKMTETLTKTFNVWVDSAPGTYLNMSKWKTCGQKEFPEITGKQVFTGIDLSSVMDLTSVGFIIILGNGEYAVLSHSFIPEETFNQRKLKDKAPFDLWERQGWITVTPGVEVNHQTVLDYIVEKYEEYAWDQDIVCFDRHLASWMRTELNNRGFMPVDILQNFTNLSEPTKDFRVKVYSNKLYHDNNPVLGWSLSNCKLNAGPSGNIMLCKAKSRDRIDPAAALITAHARAMLSGFDDLKAKSIYEKRGFLTL